MFNLLKNLKNLKLLNILETPLANLRLILELQSAESLYFPVI